MKLWIKLTLIIGLMMAVVIVVLSVALLSRARNMQIVAAEQDMLNSTMLYTEEIKNYYDDLMDSAQVLGDIMGYFEKTAPESRRRRYSENLLSVFSQNPLMVGVYSVWKPGVLDGMDDQFRSTPGCDKEGNFAPCYMQKGGETVLQLTPNAQTIYQNLPAHEQVGDPVPYLTSEGNKSFTVHLSSPIQNSREEVVGMVGVIVDLSYSQSLVKGIVPYGTGRAELYSANGTIVVSQDEDLVGRHYAEAKLKRMGAEGVEKIQQAYLSGEPVRFTSNRVMFQCIPFTIGDASELWMLVASVPAGTILKEVRAMTSFVIIFAVTALLAALGVSLLVSRRIAQPIVKVSETLKDIAQGEGDLTKSIIVRGRGEIADLSCYFNQTLGKIRELVVVIKKQSTALSEVGHELAANMGETASAVNEITATVQNIKTRVMNQSAGVRETNSTMEQITNLIDRLNSHIEDQSSRVSQSSSAVEELLANIQSVTQALVKNADGVNSLMRVSDVGRSGLEAVAKDIQGIARESEGLLAINGVMENIASQTNLLSMNAAIEAAHAGEAGKGFAVVADEIRKLAESSGEQSKTISAVLKKIKESIDKITVSTQNVLNNFEDIDQGVRVVADQEETIRRAMEEQNAGSQQILESIGQLNDLSQMVKHGSEEMLEGSREVIQEGKNLESATQEISNGIGEMASGAEEINAAVNRVNEISGQNRENIDILVQEVSRFKVE